jgi:hypothetical protein
MNECYVHHLIKKAERNGNIRDPDNVMKMLKELEKKAQRMRKLIFREMSIFKTWSLSKEESKRVDNAITTAVGLHRYCSAIINIIVSIKQLYYIAELERRLGSSVVNVDSEFKQVPEILKDMNSDMQVISGFRSRYTNADKEIKSMFEPLRQVIHDLDPKYGVPQRKKKKDESKQKFQHTYNHPKPTLPLTS